MNTMLKLMSLIIAFLMILTPVIFDQMSMEEIEIQMFLALVFLSIYVWCEHQEIGVEKKIES